jgi:hypothetical protein
MKVTASVLALGVASASADQATLLSKIKAQLTLGGATNCQYKCANMWNINNLWDSKNGNVGENVMAKDGISVLNEYIGCVAGCDSCKGGENENCMTDCKDTNWFAKTWWYNPYTGGFSFVDCGADLAKQQSDCLANIPLTDTGGRAQLSKKYTDETQKCYDHPVYGIVAIQNVCNVNSASGLDGQCRRDATCRAYTRTTQDCDANTPVEKQYAANMCGSGVLKNIIEPDKACMIGCLTNLCQEGAHCTGKGLWSAQTDKKDCQMITPQAKGEKYTIIPAVFEEPLSDVVGCCTQSRVCCSYKEAWVIGGSVQQRQSVCNVANSKKNCADPQTAAAGFNINAFGKDISKGPYPGNGCNELWQPNGICELEGFEPCPDCLQY